MLQRYCDPATPFYPLPQFNGKFIRSTDFYNSVMISLFSSSRFSEYALIRASRILRPRKSPGWGREDGLPSMDLAAIRRLDEVSTSKIEEMTRQLSQPTHAARPHL
ncbi:hypothetical protein Lade_0831 [Legionella adelaidensis]|nr:hypothetical protein Lade_0831 [Legionella adelaidensis]